MWSVMVEYIQSDLSPKFRGKNLAIVANYVEVQKSSTFDLSGLPVTHVFEYDAGQNEDGSGRDGQDGLVGKSGGNFGMYCKFLEHESILTIVSNGSDGSNGQNGGNGIDGIDGQNATRSSFVKNGFDWKMSTTIRQKLVMNRIFNLVNSTKSEVTTDDGLTAYVFKQIGVFEDWGLMLVKGGSGQPGKHGGCGGNGGAGGYPGTISVQCDQSTNSSNIKTISNVGNIGSTGLGGLNGLHGVEGRDLWKYDKRLYGNARCYGEDKPRKYKLVWGGKDGDTVWDGTRNNYIHVEVDYDIIKETSKSRNISLKTLSLVQPECANSFNFTKIKNEYLPFLEKNKKRSFEKFEKMKKQSSFKNDRGININFTFNFSPSVF